MKQMNLKGEESFDIRTDAKTLINWKKIIAICPYCLFKAPLDRFVVRYATRRKGTNISQSRVECPSCLNGMFKKTVLKTADMSMEEYAYWFWGNIFSKWGIYDKVDWDNLKERLKMHSKDNQEIFWEVYHKYKDSGDREEITKDWEDYQYYKELEQKKSSQLF